jgi:dTDP-glucose pyrophosphorylase
MKDWHKLLVSPFHTIKETLKIIDEQALQIALVVDERKKLLGTVTDGDVRRGILRGVSLDDPITEIMNATPTVALLFGNIINTLSIMKSKRLRQIPIVDDDGILVGLEVLEELIQPQIKGNWVVLMAGGLGTRLRPLTEDCPKPLLKVGTKPILETIIEQFIENGFTNFLISVNYRFEMIESYFGDGGKWGINIRYIHENKRMGTAGALSLLPVKPTNPFIVMNADLLTKINFKGLLDFHNESKTMATMCIKEFEYQIPYGVIRTDKQRLISIDEKPVQRYYINAGVYVLDPAALDFIPHDSFYDMPGLFDDLLKTDKSATIFPIREYWCDIGHLDDFDRANTEYEKVFL